ncbi:sensor histidine kinase [Zoogloea sp.]|uniref:sensor histidine kinase n=1 Tax=Zoogloea sp. TaxID=49181 RepID=UPI001416D005|nr:MAG: sensor histidine kinase [Zoogloea sp.]
MKGNSLKRHQILWLVGVLSVLLAVDAWFSYGDAQRAANHAYDRSLSASVRGIAERVYATESEVVVDVPYSALELFEAGSADRIYYAVQHQGGALITGYESLPLPAAADFNKAVFYDGVYKGQVLRLGAIVKPLYRPEFPKPVVIVVAETTHARQDVVNQLFLWEFARKGLVIAVALVVVLVATIVAVKPIDRLGATLLARPEDDLTPLDGRDVPAEIKPLVDATNHHLARIGKMLEARRRFITDAAHQLRTPLAVLNTQAEYALRQDDPGEMRAAVDALHSSLGQAIRLANQLLSLSRAEPINGLMVHPQPVDLGATAREVVIDLLPLAGRKAIDLGMEGSESPLVVDGQPLLLREMISNLVDNALRYTPPGGIVTVEVDAPAEMPGSARLRVTDNGPGVPPASRNEVFLRFFRLPGSDHTGSGLGLSIVREIVLGHHGEIRLVDGQGAGPGRPGLTVEIRLPLRAPASA